MWQAVGDQCPEPSMETAPSASPSLYSAGLSAGYYINVILQVKVPQIPLKMSRWMDFNRRRQYFTVDEVLERILDRDCIDIFGQAGVCEGVGDAGEINAND